MILAKENLDYTLPDEQPEIQQSPVKQEKNSHSEMARQKIILTFMVLCCFVMGVMVAYYYAQVAYVGLQIDALQKKVADLRLEGYGLEQEVTKIVTLGQIEKIATTELGMVKPSTEKVVRISDTDAAVDNKAVANKSVPDKQLETITLPESDKVKNQPKNKLIEAFADMVERWNL